MTYRLWACLCGGLLAAVCLVTERPIHAEDNTPEGAEIQGRGPVHEAFAQPLEGEAQQGPMAPKPPPPPPEEQPPEQRPEGENVQWVPGYWQWDDERGEFLWVTGVWREPPPGRKWVPGEYRQTENAYQWSQGFWAPEGQDGLNYLPPPPESVDEGPQAPAPDDSCSYVPGCWMYRDARYVWRPGYWLRCRPGWVWQPAHYVCSPAGCLFVAGYWDYPLERRGVLFAPVYFARAPRFWRPAFAVSLDFLPGALFVRSGHRHYYYGDYFASQYRRGGFNAWIDHRARRGGADPLWSYYRGVNANRPFERDLRGQYGDRFAGRAALPPRTLGQQNTALRNRPTNVASVTVLRPLAQSAPAEWRLVDVNRGERERQQQLSAQLRQAGTQRVRAERDLVATRQAPSRTNAAPRRVEVNIPRSTAPTTLAVPPRPDRPRESRPAQPPMGTRPPETPRQPERRTTSPRIETAAPRVQERPAVSPRIQETPAVPPRTQTVPQRPASPSTGRTPPPRIEAPRMAPPPVIRQAPPQPAPRPAQGPRPAPPPPRPAPAPPARLAQPSRPFPAPQARSQPAPARPAGRPNDKPGNSR